MRLLVDFGNTRLKWALWDNDGLHPGDAFAHAGTSIDAGVSAHWRGLPKPRSIHVASVVDEVREHELAQLVQSVFSMPAEFVRSPARALGIVNAYREPQRLGVDRFLAMAALHAQAARAQVLIGCGTALTLDALDAEGHHLGGLITASPALTRRALGLATARVGAAAGELVELAANTADAAWSGSILAAVALVERFRACIAGRLGVPVAVVADGGGIDEWLACLDGVERGRDLVLHGLALWAERRGAAMSADGDVGRSG
ncbi:MAG: type III pantothenate kinase [Xanthomonadales bacterium]|nr:type III pantothenate kinase [Xanthomonadales bacterium]